MSKYLLENFGWYDVPHMGWRIINISSRVERMWDAILLGGGTMFKVHPSLIHPIEPGTVKRTHAETRNGVKFDCYVISPAPSLDGRFHWYVDMDGHFAGDAAVSKQEAEAKAVAFIDEKQPQSKSIGKS